MLKLIILVAISVMVSSITYGFPENSTTRPSDTANNLIYIVDDSAGYMVPYIEQKIRNLEDPQHKRLYNNVASLNTIEQVEAIQVDVVNGLLVARRLDNQKAHHDSNGEKARDYNSLLKDYRSVLLIRINKFSDLIEFQFILFTNDSGAQVHLVFTASMSVFIDPRKPNYQKDIVTALNQVFTKANPSPVVKIKVNQDSAGGIFHYAEHDTVTLEPIIEDDSWEVDRSYKWSQDTSDQFSARLDINKKDQTLTNLRPGYYDLTFVFDNGITKSKSVKIVIDVLPDSKRANIAKIEYVGRRKKHNNEYFCFVDASYNTADIYSYSNLLIGVGKDDSLKFALTKENDPLHDDLQFKMTKVSYDHGLRDGRLDTEFPISTSDTFDIRHNAEFMIVKDKSDDDTIIIIPPQAQHINAPAGFELAITTSSREFRGKSQYLALNFYKIRNLFFHFGGEFDLSAPINGAFEAGLGYTIPVGNFKVNLRATEGLYLNANELSNNTSFSNFQEAYLDIPLRSLPISFKVGVRNFYFGLYNGPNNEFTGHKSQAFSLVGVDYIFSQHLLKQRISFTYLYHDSSVPYLNHLFAVSYGIDIFSAKREK